MPFLIAYCTLMRPTTPSASAKRDGVLAHLVHLRSAMRYGGSTQAESPEWMPASSMCCITPPITHARAVADRVDVGLERVLEEAVDQHRAVLATRAARPK